MGRESSLMMQEAVEMRTVYLEGEFASRTVEAEVGTAPGGEGAEHQNVDCRGI